MSVNIRPVTDIWINDTYLVPKKHVLNYQYTKDTKFGAAHGSMTLVNIDGLYSPDNGNQIKDGDEVVIIEYDYGSDQDVTEVFRGLVRKVETSISGGGVTQAIITFYDKIIRLTETDIELDVQGSIRQVTEELLIPVSLGPPNEDLARVYDSRHSAWANTPLPTIRIDSFIGIGSLTVISGRILIDPPAIPFMKVAVLINSRAISSIAGAGIEVSSR